MRQPPIGYKHHPVWIAFELWADEHHLATAMDDWYPWWECFLAGVEVGRAEEA